MPSGNTAAPAGHVTASDVAYLAEQAGFKGAGLATAVAVSFAENSSHAIDAVHHNSDGSIDVGLWQINSVHGYSQADMEIPAQNAAAAYAISNGGKNWTPWVTYTSGKARTSAIQSEAQSAIDNGTPFSTGNFASHLSDDATGWTHSVTGFISLITSGAFWHRIGLYAAGIVLVLFALGIAFRKPAAAAASKIPKVVPV